jgi:alkyldihydroxyacetonephosphate synthase
VVFAISLFERAGFSTRDLQKLLSLLDLPLLFFPFMKNSFHFQSDLVAPDCFDAKRYVFSCGVAAHRFISGMHSKKQNHSSESSSARASFSTRQKMAMVVVGGKAYKAISSDLWWALSQPKGDYLIRFASFLFVKILRAVCSVVTVDTTSFRNLLSSISREDSGRTFLILAPTHRSFFDFILLSYVCFALPELQVDIPFIVAADEFEQLPVIGWLARLLRAFYIHRGKGYGDPALAMKLKSMKESNLSAPGACLEVFLEGKRSRDRRYVDPKTGFLKSLSESGGDHVFIPITINYEGIPEQRQLSEEASGTDRQKLNVLGMLEWLRDVASGKINIGKIHVAAGDPLAMACENRDGFKEFANEIQRQQQELVFVSDYHVEAASKFFCIDPMEMQKAMVRLGCKFWPQTTVECPSCPLPQIPDNQSDLCTIVFQMSHQLAPMFYSSRREWSDWLNRLALHKENQPLVLDRCTQPIYDLLLNYFDSADYVVDEALQKLKDLGFMEPKSYHVFQTAKTMNQKVPVPLIHAAVSMKVSFDSKERCHHPSAAVVSDLRLQDTQEKLGFWGFHDSGFIVKSNQRGQRMVMMKGDRYSLSGSSLTKLLPFMESEMQVRINPLEEFPAASPIWCQACICKLETEDQEALCQMFSRASFATLDRVRHGTGHSQEDVYLIRSGDSIRIPDAVVWPSSEEEVERLVDVARKKGWCLIPFGGGTNVSNATRCPAEDIEKRPIVSVDMKDMCRILWLNEEDGLAHVEAGITGRQLVDELERRGYTMGHEPDSIEFSTLGGWIATKASGMKRSKYGNIEDIVKSARVVGPEGLLWKGTEDQHVVPGRVAEGLDVCSLVLGSEGCLGIITSAVIRVWPLPEVREYDSVILPSFKDGLQFVRAVAKLGSNAPASVRLLDNAHFRLGQALRPDHSSVIGQVKDMMMKFASSAVGNLDPMSVVCATIGYEGSKFEVQAQKRKIRELAGMHGGVMLGSKIGKAGYELTFMIAYLRDFAMTYHLLGESFETFAPWSKIESLIAATKQRIVEEHTSRLLPGVPFVGCRVTQLYHEGACLYFYLCISFDGVEHPSEVFAALEKAARDEILIQGGSLSHHHGIGKIRAPMLKGRASSGFDKTMAGIKKGIDKDNIFGARNGVFAFCSE